MTEGVDARSNFETFVYYMAIGPLKDSLATHHIIYYN